MAKTTTPPTLRTSSSEMPVIDAETQPSSYTRAQEDRPTIEGFEKLASQNPQRALALALAEPDSSLREELLQAVLRGWAGTIPDAAADWALAQSHLDQGLAMAAVFNGANKNPDAAIRLAERLSAQHPEHSSSYGSYLIFGLARVGKFELAATFAAASASDIRTELLTAAYTYWAQQQPERAVYEALKLNDPAKQDAAFHAAVGGWARINPTELTNAAAQFPEGADRTLALTTGLRSWLEKDPTTAGDWIAQHKLSAKETEMVLEE